MRYTRPAVRGGFFGLGIVLYLPNKTYHNNDSTVKRVGGQWLHTIVNKHLNLNDDRRPDLASLAIPPSNRLEALGRERRGQHSIRINEQYRISFKWADKGAEGVEIVDYH